MRSPFSNITFCYLCIKPGLSVCSVVYYGVVSIKVLLLCDWEMLSSVGRGILSEFELGGIAVGMARRSLFGEIFRAGRMQSYRFLMAVLR